MADLDAQPTFAGLAGVARRELTPPVGIYARCWGAATSDTAAGVHRPMTVTALALGSTSGRQPLLLVALDHWVWRTAQDEWHIRAVLQEELGLPAERVLVCLSHTHAAPSASTADIGRDGGGFIAAYRDALRDAVAAAGRAAVADLRPAIVDWESGWSGLARNRDLPAGDRFLCGYNPAGESDGTLLVGRVTTETGDPLATIVNYACHPTTLAWENRLISPDWVASMRDTVENEVGGLCLFLQGASGELAPREQHTSSIERADEQGRALGLAVVATLAGMLPPSTGLDLADVVESGAPLGVWRRQRFEPDSTLDAVTDAVRLTRQPALSPEALRERWKTIGESAAAERVARAVQQQRELGDTETIELPYWIWRVGDALIVGQPGEAYSWLQQELRRQFPTHAVAVVNLTNGMSVGYLPPASRYNDNLYQVWQSPFAAGSLETLADAVVAGARQLSRVGDAANLPASPS